MSISLQQARDLVKKMVNHATVERVASNRHHLMDPDWESNFRVVDLANKDVKITKLVANEILSLLKQHSKDPRVIWLVIVLLETCVKNCGISFHKEIATKEFVERLKKIAGKKISKPGQKFIPRSAEDFQNERVENKVLQLIQSWGPLHPLQMPIFEETYHELVEKGIQFPTPSPEDILPLTEDQHLMIQRKSSDSIKLPEEIKTFLNEVKTTVTLLESILENKGPNENLSENEIAQELVLNCEAKKKKLQEYVEQYLSGKDENLISTLLLAFEKVEKVLANYQFSESGKIISDIEMKEMETENEHATIDRTISIRSSPQMEIPKRQRKREEENSEISNEQKKSFSSSSPSSSSPAAAAEAEAQSSFLLSKSPLELGIDYLESITNAMKCDHIKPKDELLEWLMSSSIPILAPIKNENN